MKDKNYKTLEEVEREHGIKTLGDLLEGIPEDQQDHVIKAVMELNDKHKAQLKRAIDKGYELAHIHAQMNVEKRFDTEKAIQDIQELYKEFNLLDEATSGKN